MESRAIASVVNHVDISCSEVMKHHVSDECLALCNIDSTFRKTQKSKLLHKLAQQPFNVHSYTAYVDMGILWWLTSLTTEEREKGWWSPYSWGDYTSEVASMLLACHANSSIIICINYPYDYSESIKDDKWDLRIQGQSHVPKVFMKTSGDTFPSARKFKTRQPHTKQKNACPPVHQYTR